MPIEIQRNSPTRWVAHSMVLPDGNGSADVFHVEYDPASTSVTLEIVTTIATIKNVEPTRLTPLATCVDVEMLHSFVDPDANSALFGSTLSFEYEGMDVTVNPNGDIWLEWGENGTNR